MEMRCCFHGGEVLEKRNLLQTERRKMQLAPACHSCETCYNNLVVLLDLPTGRLNHHVYRDCNHGTRPQEPDRWSNRNVLPTAY